MGGDREGQPHVHPARVALHRHVDEVADLGEGDDRLELGSDLRAAHPEDRAVEEDVLAARELLVEARADLEQRAEAARDPGVARGRGHDPRQDLEQRALARAVEPDDPDRLAAGDLEAHVPQRPEARGPVRRPARSRHEAAPALAERIAQGIGLRP